MPIHRLERTRAAYDEPEQPESRCLCGAGMNEPHRPECYRGKVEAESACADFHGGELFERGYGMGV